MAIQGAFGWENSHLFQFCENDLTDRVGYGVPYDQDSGAEIIDARKTRISKVFKSPGQQYCYIYDFGDYWKHKVIFERAEDKDMDFPFCLEGKGACPPEDVGGIHGYNEMLGTLKDTGSEEAKDFRMWLGLCDGELWDANFCSVREVNKRLCLLG
jgi:hypothetical protein